MKYDPEFLENYWMPFTSNRDFKADPRIVERSEGMYMYNDSGDRILDGSSALFCCAAGHSRPEIAEAVHNQLKECAYVPPFQLAQPLAFELARRVAKLTPDGLDHIFFGCSGSEAIDSAMKIVYAYHYARGEGQRQRFVSRERAYHGVNMAGVSLSGMIKNRQA
ncbi:MAG: aminotransferase class III-fold pyridoxal phosphate-dependent enzyme, partial [Arenicellales bacterium]|nr:aminotransferase class III-fold pyridoxal phosphate-dependent enzyme [Arenicellales bacterium]